MEVLQSKAAVESARRRLEERGISCLGMEVGPPLSLWQKLLRRRPPTLGDQVKSWDVLRTAEFVEQHFPKSARILDLGAYSSEILCVLHRLGFERLTGVDLNPNVRAMPFRDRIRYEVGDFLRTPFADASFDVVTSISVIEHGLDAPALLTELSRLIAPGGCFLASFDYWPEKIDTSGTKFFGMDWLIFSREDVRAFLAEAANRGFAVEGPLSFDASEPSVNCAGRDYTFGWLVLRRR
ncbi:MAG TPA: class I SAM-dependent methyltransferase [Anaeromyxobacteraceae bacterium]|nr:class I SAM-dependent methyltransferase [Anaeromyxobacteraceae bacterium]